jgi:hypothetical protein
MTDKFWHKKKQDEKIYNPFRPASQQPPVNLRQSSIIIRLHHHSSCSTINIRAKKTRQAAAHTQQNNTHLIYLTTITSFSLNRTTMSGKPCAPFLFFFKKNPCRNGQGQNDARYRRS